MTNEMRKLMEAMDLSETLDDMEDLQEEGAMYVAKLENFGYEMENLKYEMDQFLASPPFQNWIDRIEEHGGGGTDIIGQYVDNMQQQMKTFDQLIEYFYSEVQGMQNQVKDDPLGQRFSGGHFKRPFFHG